MKTIHVRDKNGDLRYSADGVTPTTFSIAKPGTFDPLPAGKIDLASFRRKPTKKELEVTKHVCGCSDWASEGKTLECSQALVLAILMKAPWYRRQLEDAIAELNESGG